MKGSLWTVIVIACALALVVPLVNGGLADAETTDRTESATVDYDVNYTLAVDGSEYPSLSVTTNTTTLTNGTDYLFDAEAATIDWQNTTATTDGEAATIEYTAVDRTQTTENVVTILETAGSWAGFLLLIAAMGYIVVLMGGGGF